MPIAFATGGSSTGGTGGTGGTNPPPATNGVTWSGQENLQGFGKLSFVFQTGGKVTMYDVSKSYSGTWSQNGKQITINLPSIGTTYVGTMNGNTISGQGSGKIDNQQKQWTFSVNRTK
jgi:hypothetical protein